MMFVFHHYQINKENIILYNPDENKNYNEHVEYITNRNLENLR